jgi:hypothetical protein
MKLRSELMDAETPYAANAVSPCIACIRPGLLKVQLPMTTHDSSADDPSAIKDR